MSSLLTLERKPNKKKFKSISNGHLSLSLLLVCSYIPVVPSKTIHDSQNQKGQKTIPLYKGVLPPRGGHSSGEKICLGDGLCTLGWIKTVSWQMFSWVLMYLVNKIFVFILVVVFFLFIFFGPFTRIWIFLKPNKFYSNIVRKEPKPTQIAVHMIFCGRKAHSCKNNAVSVPLIAFKKYCCGSYD